MTGETSDAAARNRCAENAERMLEIPRVRKKLAELLAFYYSDTTDVTNWAASENEGVRQEALENEIYSCFHHIARGLCSGEAPRAEAELEKGKGSHLKRLLYDAYKIVISNHLESFNATVRVLDYVILSSDYRNFDSAGFQECLAAHELAKDIKKLFLEAKNLESAGNPAAEERFRDAAVKCSELEEKILVFQDNASYKVCVAKFVKDEREKKELRDSQETERRKNEKWRKRNFFVAVSAVVVSVVAVVVSVLVATSK